STAGMAGADPSAALGQVRGGSPGIGGSGGGDGCSGGVGGIPGTPTAGGAGGGGGGCGVVRIYGERAITGSIVPPATPAAL
ncbi:MAG: hypothetical protein M3680_30090, partial [Myxococcota bacterium]|nr:hypothetical protein [Myxococcota bacterium]